MTTVNALALPVAASAQPAQSTQQSQAQPDLFASHLEHASREVGADAPARDRAASSDRAAARDRAGSPEDAADAVRDANPSREPGEGSTTEKATDDAPADEASTDEVSTDDAAAAAGAAPATPTTDSAGPGIASSGEASQDPAVTLAAAQASTTTQGDAASDVTAESAAAVTASGTAGEPVPASHGGTVAATTAAAPATESAATPGAPGSGEQSPVAPASQADGQASQDAAGQQGDTSPRSRDAVAPTAASQERTAEATPAAAAGATEAAPASAGDKAVQAQAPTAVPAMAPLGQAQAPVPAQSVAASAPNQPTFATPLSTQLTGQLTSLKQLPQGDHVLTLMVNPESFGPVRVVAHIGREGVSLEIFGASEQARAALRAALPDLRRDLAGAGLEPHLELGTGTGERGSQADQSGLSDQGDGQQRPARSTFGIGALGSTSSQPTTPSRVTRRGGIDLDL